MCFLLLSRIRMQVFENFKSKNNLCKKTDKIFIFDFQIVALSFDKCHK